MIVDRRGERLGLLTGNPNRILLKETQIAPVMKHAIIAIEDKRFYTNDGVDLRGIGRALYQDVVAQKAVQGGSTIAQQFVKNSLAAQDRRTLFVKLREAALAYHITRRWTKGKILRNYLNTIYFGNGAYGIESAARTYFGRQHPGCERDRARPCAAQLEPEEAAMIAGVVASPSAFDPVAHPAAARERRDLVLRRMLEQRLIAREQYDTAIAEPVPSRRDVQPPREDTQVPLLHLLDQAAGGRQARRRPDRRPPGLRGRPDRPDHDRRALPEGRRRRDQRLAAQPGRAARLARRDRQPQRRGPRDGRRRRLQHARRSTSPPRASASRGRRSSRSCSPRRSSAGSRRAPSGPRARRSSTCPAAARSSRSRTTTTPTPGVDLARRRDDDLRQLRLRRGRHQGRHQADRHAWPAGWASARRSRATGRSRSAASSRASRRSTWPTPTRRSRARASSSTAR